jgi:GNAT superfamily N-acetyltransferase
VDHWHGRGVATALLERLVERAREEGVRVFLQGALREAATGALEGRDPALRQPKARARPRSG